MLHLSYTVLKTDRVDSNPNKVAILLHFINYSMQHKTCPFEFCIFLTFADLQMPLYHKIYWVLLPIALKCEG